MKFTDGEKGILGNCLGGMVDNEHDKGAGEGLAAESAAALLDKVEGQDDPAFDALDKGLAAYALRVYGEIYEDPDNGDEYLAEAGATRGDLQALLEKFPE